MQRDGDPMNELEMGTSNSLAAEQVTAWLAAHGLIAVTEEELADLQAASYKLQAISAAFHGHGVAFSYTTADSEIAWSWDRVEPRRPFDTPDLPAPYRSLRLTVYAAITMLRSGPSPCDGTLGETDT